MTTQQRNEEIAAIRKTAAAEMGENMFLLFDLLVCGHVTEDQQKAFLLDAKNRGLLK